MKMKIDIGRIQVDHDIQLREATNTDVINEYAEKFDNLPPLKVFHDGEHFWLADGFHRYAAAQKLKRQSLVCEVEDGSKRAAILYACGANQAHGLRRTNADKRRAVERLLADEEWSGWSNRRIAETAGVSDMMVKTVRDQVQDSCTSNSSRTVTAPTWGSLEAEKPASEKRTGTDGKQYPVKKKQPETEARVEPVESATNDDDKYAAHKVTASEINGLASRVRQWQKDLAEKKRLTGGEYIDMDPIIDKVDVLVRMVRDMAFAGECPACQGKGCKECRKLGWVSVGAAKR